MNAAAAPTDQPDLMTAAEVAEFCRLPLRTIDDWRYRKVGPAWLRVGRRVRYRRSALLEWLESQELAGRAAS